jgi:hypothetical protein
MRLTVLYFIHFSNILSHGTVNYADLSQQFIINGFVYTVFSRSTVFQGTGENDL